MHPSLYPVDGSLFSCGKFGFLSLSLFHGVCNLSSGSSFAARTTGLGFSLLAVFEHGFVVVNELDEASLGVVAEAVAGLENTGVTTGAVADLLSDFLEENLDSFFVLKIAEDEAAVGHGVFLGAVDQGLSIDAECLCLCKRGVDTLVEDERDGHIGKQGSAVSFLAAKVIEFFIVSHRGLFFIEFVF